MCTTKIDKIIAFFAYAMINNANKSVRCQHLRQRISACEPSFTVVANR